MLKTVPGLLILTLLCGCVSNKTFEQQVAVTEQTRQQLQQQQAANRDLQQQNNSLAADLKELRDQQSECLGNLNNCSADLDICGVDRQRLEEALSNNQISSEQAADNFQRQIGSLSEERTELQKRIEREKIARLARMANLKNTYEQLVGQLEQQLTESMEQGLKLRQGLAECSDNLAAEQRRNDSCRQQLAQSNKTIEMAQLQQQKLAGESQIQISKLRQERDQLQQQLNSGDATRKSAAIRLKTALGQLSGALAGELKQGELTLADNDGRLTLNLPARTLFDSGAADLNPKGKTLLKAVGSALKQIRDLAIRIEGHTDSQPVSDSLRATFPSNWELSTARAANVLHFFQQQSRLPGKRLSIVGYGPYRPVADNNTPAGREQNRRIQIVLQPRQGE